MEISLSPDILFYIKSFPVTNTFFWTIILSFSIIIFFIYFNRSLKKIPGRFQVFVEIITEGVLRFIQTVTGDEKKAKKAFPLIFTMFILILTANLATYIPGQSAITIKKADGAVPLFRAIMSDYSLVFVMTLISVIASQIIAIYVNGPFKYAGKFINLSGLKFFFKNFFKGKVQFGQFFQGLLDLFLGLMDVVGEVAKIVSLSFRLFGNIFAGEVLTAVTLFLVPFIAPLPFMFLGLLTAVVQAFVFSVLTLIFITMSSEVSTEEI